MSKSVRQRAIPYLVLVISLFFTLIATASALKLNFDRLVNAQQTKISEELENRVALLRGIAGFFAARSGVTRDEFQTYASRLQLDRAYADVDSIGYAARLADADGEHFPISYLEPWNEVNQRELGLDMSTNPVLRPTLNQAQDSGLPAISGRWSRISGRPAFLICVPVYTSTASVKTVEERRDFLDGFIFSVIRPDVFIQHIMEAPAAGEIGLQVFNSNEANPARLLYSSAVLTEPRPYLTTQRTIDVAGGSWTLVFSAQSVFPSGQDHPWFALLMSGGMLMSFVLFVMTRSNVIVRTAADYRAEQLRTSKGIQEQLSAQLEQHRTKFKELISQMPGVVWEAHGKPGGILKMVFISDYVEKMLGYGVTEWIEQPNFWLDIVYPEDRDRVAREVAGIFEAGGGGIKFRCIARDGRVVWVETHAAVILDRHGEATGMRGVTMDITARRRAEETLRDKETRLQIALSAARMASWHWDLITGNLMWDDAPCTWTDFLKRVHPEDQSAVRVAVDHALQEMQDLDLEFRVVQPDSVIRWLTLKAKVFQGEDGRPAYITGVSVDITDRRRSAEALRASEERYRLAARATNDAIWDWDLAAGCVQWNEGIRTLFGYGAEHVGTGVNWRWEQIHADDRERVVSGINAVIKGGGRFWSDEYRFRCANGSFSTVTDRAYIEQNESGQAVRLIAAMTDVTRLKQAEREREQLLRLEQAARKQAESANRLKDEFLATLSHELRTPITPILGWTHLLRTRASNPADLKRGLDVIEQNARSQAKLIEDLLDVSRIVTGKMQLKIQTAKVQPIIKAALDCVQPAADAKGVRIELTTDRSSPQIAVDPDRLQQVVWNLLSNAIKFTPGGGVIRVSTERAGTEMRIVVCDNGEGIDPEFLPHVFDRFSQADSTNVRVHGGLGVGLAIVRYILELHGGHITVESRGKGQGATFTATLPARSEEPPPKPKRSRRIAKALSSLKGLRLLVVDDEPHARELLTLILEHEGAVVTTAASAQEAIAVLEKNSPDVLITDIAMPGENGYVLLEKLRNMERELGRHRVPAIALTAYAREEDRQRALQAGFEQHLSKPVEPESLISVILRIASKHLGKAG